MSKASRASRASRARHRPSPGAARASRTEPRARPRKVGASCGAAQGRGAGFTLIEILVVVSIVMVLLSMSVAGYVALTSGAEFEAAWSRVETIVRRARNNTRYETAPAGVFIEEVNRAELRNPTEFLEGEILGERKDEIVFDVKGRSKAAKIPRDRLVSITRAKRVRAVGFRTVGAWHLEQSDDSFGYLGRSLKIKGGANAFGKLGGAIILNDDGTDDRMIARPASDDVGDPFRLPTGGRIEMWVYALPGGAGGDGYLARRKGSYELKVRRDGVIVGGTPGETVETEGYVLSFHRWAKVALAFSAGYVEISVDDVVRASVGIDDGGLSPPEEEELIFGERFAGLLDEIRVQQRVEADGFDLPAGYELTGPDSIVFLRGRLDPSFHSGPVRLQLASGEKRAGMTVFMSGRTGKQ